ncbi:Hexokinase [Cooperia oncophora]
MMLGVLGLACLYRRDNDSKRANYRLLADLFRSWNQSRVRLSKDDEEFSIERDIKKIAGRARLRQREYFSLESVMDEFQLSNETLRRLMSHMNEYMDRGLEGGLEKSTIAMLPSFLAELPDGTERGKFVALDLGGTNLRVMTMYVEPGKEMETEQFNTSVPKAAMQGTGEQLFDYITKVLADFLVEKGLADENLPLGFTFSYPCDQTSIRVATLSRWTKGFTASGVIGEDVVRLLEEAIKRDGRIKVEVVAVLNDTVGTIVAGAYEMKGKCDLGVIIGTGTNASYMENTESNHSWIKKASEPYHHKQMIIDTEWGGFGDRGEAEYIRTQYDKIVDKRSDHPGNYCFDKLVAGKCMGEVVRLVLEKLCTLKVLFNGERSNLLYTVGSFPTKYISEILRDDWGTYSNTKQIMDELGIEDYSFSDILLFREVCLVVSRRSANLIAAGQSLLFTSIKFSPVVGPMGSLRKYKDRKAFRSRSAPRKLV